MYHSEFTLKDEHVVWMCCCYVYQISDLYRGWEKRIVESNESHW